MIPVNNCEGWEVLVGSFIPFQGFKEHKSIYSMGERLMKVYFNLSSLVGSVLDY